MNQLTITLAGKDYQIGPLTVGQLEELHVGVMRIPNPDPQQEAREFWKQNIGIIAAALQADHPEMTREVIEKMRLGSIRKVNEAVSGILRFAGLAAEPESKPGEAVAGAE